MSPSLLHFVMRATLFMISWGFLTQPLYHLLRPVMLLISTIISVSRLPSLKRPDWKLAFPLSVSSAFSYSFDLL